MKNKQGISMEDGMKKKQPMIPCRIAIQDTTTEEIRFGSVNIPLERGKPDVASWVIGTMSDDFYRELVFDSLKDKATVDDTGTYRVHLCFGDTDLLDEIRIKGDTECLSQ